MTYQWDDEPRQVSLGDLKKTHCEILSAIWAVDSLCRAIQPDVIYEDEVLHALMHGKLAIDSEMFCDFGVVAHLFVNGFCDLRGGSALNLPAVVGNVTAASIHTAARSWAMRRIEEIYDLLEIAREEASDETEGFDAAIANLIRNRADLFHKWKSTVDSGVTIDTLQSQLEMEFTKAIQYASTDTDEVSDRPKAANITPSTTTHKSDIKVSWKQLADAAGVSERRLDAFTHKFSGAVFTKHSGSIAATYYWNAGREVLVRIYPNKEIPLSPPPVS